MLLFLHGTLFSQTPVASFPFTGNANDVSGNGNNGKLGGEKANPILTSDRFGNPNSAYEFGGFYNKNWIQVPNSSSLKFNGQMSISLWFNQCSFAGMDGWGSFTPNGYHILISKAGDGISANPGFYSGILTDLNNILNLNIGNTNGYGQVHNFDASTKINCFDICEWIHFVVVVNNDKLQMYFNGQLKIDQTIKQADFTNANTQDLFIGRMNGSGTIWYPFKGKIDDINIYNVALTQQQVTSLLGNYANPLAINNTITLDSLRVANLACDGSKKGNISVYPNSNNAPYQFSIDGGTTYQSSGIFPKLNAGKYNVRVKTNCNQKDTVINIGTSVNVNKAVSICEGQNYMGHSTSGIFVQKLTAKNGCDSIVTTKLTVNPNPVVSITSTENPICNGNSTKLTANGASGYLWSNGLGTSNSITVNPVSQTTYSVTGTSSGCSKTATLTVKVNSRPVAHFITAPEIVSILNPDVSFTDKSIGVPPLSWHWSLGNGDTSDIQNFNYTYSDTGKYLINLVIRDQFGCVDSVSNYIIVQPGYSISIPNAFTPNGDGYNDSFGAATKGIKSQEMNIYDRNGRFVHKIDLVNGSWDGLMPSGTTAPQGVYFFILKALGYDDQEYLRQGSVNLYRENINLVPNPVKSTSVLNLSSRFSGDKIITIFNLSGMPLRIFNTNEDIISLDLTFLDTGFYILKAANPSQCIYVKFSKE